MANEPTPVSGTHYSTLFEYATALVREKQIRVKRSSVNPGIPRGIPGFIILGEDLEERWAAAPPAPPPGAAPVGGSLPPSPGDPPKG